MLCWSEGTVYLITFDILKTSDKSLTVFLDPIFILAHCLVESTPLRIVAQSYCRRENIVKSNFFHSLFGPKTHVLEMGVISGAWKTNIMWEENTSNCVLVTMNCISSQKEFNLVFSTIFSGDGNA